MIVAPVDTHHPTSPWWNVAAPPWTKKEVYAVVQELLVDLTQGLNVGWNVECVEIEEVGNDLLQEKQLPKSWTTE